MARRKINADFHAFIPQREIARLKRVDLEHKLRPFLDEWAHAILTLAATTPEAEWPQMLRIAFTEAERKRPALADLYIKNHEITTKGN